MGLAPLAMVHRDPGNRKPVGCHGNHTQGATPKGQPEGQPCWGGIHSREARRGCRGIFTWVLPSASQVSKQPPKKVEAIPSWLKGMVPMAPLGLPLGYGSHGTQSRNQAPPSLGGGNTAWERAR